MGEKIAMKGKFPARPKACSRARRNYALKPEKTHFICSAKKVTTKLSIFDVASV